MSLLAGFAAARTAGDPAALARAVPYLRGLGITARWEAAELVTWLPFSPALIGDPALPALHGGVVGSLLEAAATFELAWRGPAPVVPRPIVITIDYLRSARPLKTHAVAHVRRRGRRFASVDVVAWQDDRDRPIASAHGHFAVTG